MDTIAELRAKAEQLVAIGDHVKNQWRASEWQRTQCLDHAPLVAKAMLALLDDLARYKAALDYCCDELCLDCVVRAKQQRRKAQGES